jgi:choline-glycine betaine transporter
MKKLLAKVHPIAFFSSLGLLSAAVVFSIVDSKGFYGMTSSANDWLIANFGGVFSITGLLTVIGCLVAYFSPLGNIRIGGEQATPTFSRIKAFYITLCTTIAAGVVFWGTVEPMYHISSPPPSLGLEPFSAGAIRFAMETMFLHWTITPYAIYTLPTIVFAFAYYNMRKPFSVSSQFAPLLGKWSENRYLTQVIDGIVLLCIAAGMAASFATGTLNMGGAVQSIMGIPSGLVSWIVIAAVTVATFLTSSISGLNKGIRVLSDLNMNVYWVILAVMIIFGPTAFNLNLGTEALGGYLSGFFQKSLMTGAAAKDQWPQWWTTFYWANWMAWAPVAACFLGRVAYGHKIKDVITFTLVWPALFGMVWMTIFSGTAIHLQITGQMDLVGLLKAGNASAIPYAVLSFLPFAKVIIVFFLFITFISFVTAADSTTNAMAALTSTGIMKGEEEAPMWMKVLWGVGLGIIAIVMLVLGGLDGIKMLSNLGGAPATLFEILAFISIFILSRNTKKFNHIDEQK